MEIARTNRRNAVILSAVGLIGVAAMTGIAIAGNVDWGLPGSPPYATYELVNRLTGLALAAMVAAPLALRVVLASRDHAWASHTAATVVAVALCGMVVGSVLEFWAFTDQPYQGPGSEGRNLAWMTFLLSGMVVLLASSATGVLMLRRQIGPTWSGAAVAVAGPMSIVAAFLGAPFLIGVPLMGLAMCGASLQVARRPAVPLA